WAKSAWKARVIPQIEWEPHGVSLASIGSGAHDAYLAEFARGVRRANVPITMSFAHEMNGYWYSWGRPNGNPSATQAAQFVRAWRHVHDVFVQQGATNVIWLWSPNTIGPMPKVRLKPYWPGAAYVDWVGVIGYYRHKKGPENFKAIFDPTITEIRKFTKKQILLSEVAARRGKYRNADIRNLLTTIAQRKYLIGLSWFNINKTGAGAEDDWRIENSKSSLKTFKTYVKKYPFGRK
ncbi:MAG: glycosyl hydrolase, partial [Streptosporangiaceae bacterium]